LPPGSAVSGFQPPKAACAFAEHDPTEDLAEGAGGQIGDIVTGSVQKRIPNSSIEKGQIVKGVIVRTRGAYRREDGSYIRFDDNAVVLINEKLEPIGTRIFGPVPRELRHKNMIRILSLAPEVL